MTRYTDIPEHLQPWGFPSSPITIASLPSGLQVAFLARHGSHHTINPSSVPTRANIAALKSLGVQAVIAFSAVGSLREEIRPGDFIVPNQIIDRTKGVRPASFFEGTGIVAHAMFGDPFDEQLVGLITPLVKKVLDEEAKNVTLHSEKCVVVMEGPQFSTRAESHMYRAWGGDIINMSTLPEAKLAREAELRCAFGLIPRNEAHLMRISCFSYALIATATDYDSWRINEEPVTVAEVMRTLKTNADSSRKVAAALLQDVSDAIAKGDVLTQAVGSMKFSIATQPHAQKEEDRKKLAYILPQFD